jgi:hypothetical protein
MDTITPEIPTVIGALFAGGYYAGRIRLADGEYALIVAPKERGELAEAALQGEDQKVDGAGACSYNDGRANTQALADAGSELARWALGLDIGGFKDWYLPSRDELEIVYRAFKPTNEENYCGSGDNPSAIPPTWPYRPGAPAQTAIEAFRDVGAEAFSPEDYWTSTQYAGNESYAWYQWFYSGTQDGCRKDGELRARAVRRLKV